MFQCLGGDNIVRIGWDSTDVHLHGQHRHHPRHLLQVHLLQDVQVGHLLQDENLSH